MMEVLYMCSESCSLVPGGHVELLQLYKEKLHLLSVMPKLGQELRNSFGGAEWAENVMSVFIHDIPEWILVVIIILRSCVLYFACKSLLEIIPWLFCVYLWNGQFTFYLYYCLSFLFRLLNSCWYSWEHFASSSKRVEVRVTPGLP